ncbi:AcrR family transcriptional regulator [Marmoricola sp. OAE513]|uniref:TetR/AcrR family transcriptional regulator n=1 Tax=Marmoricola sp. OAE513 TaxID=2817894 RepID=UPI001AE81961
MTEVRTPVPAQPGPGSRPRRTQAERRAESDRRLLEATAELVVERGIEGTSLAEIGRRAGYSHGLVHARFGSKDALIERLNAEAVRMFTTTTVGRVGDTHGADALRIVGETYLRLVLGPDPVARVHLLVWSEAIATGVGKRPYRAAWDRLFRSSLVSIIEAGIADGSIRPSIDPEAAAVIIVGLLRGVALQLLLDPGAGSAAAVTEVVLNHFDRVLRPAAPPAPATVRATWNPAG